MTNKKRLDFGFELKSVSENGEFDGYGAVFNVEDSYSDVIQKGAFEKSLSKWKEKSRLPAMLWQHQVDEPIGVYTDMHEDDHGLYVKGQLLIDSDQLAKRAYGHLKAGSISGMSIGFNYEPDGVKYDSEQDVYLVSGIDLWEVSLVTFPANDEARVSSVKNSLASGDVPDARAVERILRDAGFSRRQAKLFMSRGYSGVFRERDVPAVEDLQNLKSIIHGVKNG